MIRFLCILNTRVILLGDFLSSFPYIMFVVVENVKKRRNNEFLFPAPGESPEIAEEEAMKSSLRNLFQTSTHRTPLPFSNDAAVPMGARNRSISEFVTDVLQ